MHRSVYNLCCEPCSTSQPAMLISKPHKLEHRARAQPRALSSVPLLTRPQKSTGLSSTARASSREPSTATSQLSHSNPTSRLHVINGGATTADVALHARGTPDLTAQVEDLRALVQLQQSVIDKQQASIQDLLKATTQKQEDRRSEPGAWNNTISPFEAQRIGIGDRRLHGMYDARFHSTASGATPKDFRILPDKIFLVRHAESEGNVDNIAYTYIPDSQVPLTEKGVQQAQSAGRTIRNYLEQEKNEYKLFFYTSPYKRSLQTYEAICSAFTPQHILGLQEEVQLREQDFGNFQDLEGKKREKAERLRFGRFFYRFPNGESGADVYDRITIFEDHMIRDINAGRFSCNSSLVLVTHGLALRVFLMRWFHWTVDQFLNVYNPPNAEPLVLERVADDLDSRPPDAVSWLHTKSLYRLSDNSMRILKGCTSDMCMTDHLPRMGSKLGTLHGKQQE